MAYFLYFLRCKDGSIYTGVSQDVEQRFLQHQQGKGAKYTKSHKVVSIIASFACQDKREALRLEYFAKTWSKQKKESFLEKASIDEIRREYIRKKERKEGKKKKV